MEIENNSFTKFAFEVFDTEWYVWRHLEALGLWDVKEEIDISLPGNPTMVEPNANIELKMKKFMTKACLFATISTNIFASIMSIKSSKEIWEYKWWILRWLKNILIDFLVFANMVWFLGSEFKNQGVFKIFLLLYLKDMKQSLVLCRILEICQMYLWQN